MSFSTIPFFFPFPFIHSFICSFCLFFSCLLCHLCHFLPCPTESGRPMVGLHFLFHSRSDLPFSGNGVRQRGPTAESGDPHDTPHVSHGSFWFVNTWTKGSEPCECRETELYSELGDWSMYPKERKWTVWMTELLVNKHLYASGHKGLKCVNDFWLNYWMNLVNTLYITVMEPHDIFCGSEYCTELEV